MNLLDSQAAFVHALLDPTAPVPTGLIDPDGLPSVRRFGIYRNNVVVGLIEAIRDSYPAVQRIVGNDFFSAMARIYVAANPPSSPIMLDYGDSFPEFVRDFEPAFGLAYLHDVASIERAWTNSYHTVEATSVEAEAFSTVEQDLLPKLRLFLHPSLRIVRSAYPAVTIWNQNTGAGSPLSIDLDSGGEDALVVRPHAEVVVRLLPPGGAAFISSVIAGETLGTAVSIALAEAPDFVPAASLLGLLESQVIIGFHVALGCEDMSEGLDETI